jgi:hypothetical protein
MNRHVFEQNRESGVTLAHLRIERFDTDPERDEQTRIRIVGKFLLELRKVGALEEA